jgi:hypothetical protein
MTRNRPDLVINYAPQLDLRIAFASARNFGGLAPPEYRFEVECRLRHPSGSFTYSVTDLCFEPQAFAQFCEELHAMQRGLRRDAALKNVGEMMVLQLEGDTRKLVARLNIREYLAPSIAQLDASFDVDYDLFVNQLPGKIAGFVEELDQIEPSPQEPGPQ